MVSLSGDISRLLPFTTEGFPVTVLPVVEGSVTLLASFEVNGNLPIGGCSGRGAGVLPTRPTGSASVVKGAVGLVTEIGLSFGWVALLVVTGTDGVELNGLVAETPVLGKEALVTGLFDSVVLVVAVVEAPVPR